VKLHDAAQLKGQEMSRLLDNVSAISAEVHGDERYHEFYMRVRENLAGFPGVWQLCVQAAQEFTVEEGAYEDDSFEWIGAIKAFASAILTAPSDKPAGAEEESPPPIRLRSGQVFNGG